MSNYVDYKQIYTLKLTGYEIVRIREYFKTAVIKAKDIEMFSELKNKFYNLEEQEKSKDNSNYINKLNNIQFTSNEKEEVKEDFKEESLASSKKIEKKENIVDTCIGSINKELFPKKNQRENIVNSISSIEKFFESKINKEFSSEETQSKESEEESQEESNSEEIPENRDEEVLKSLLKGNEDYLDENDDDDNKEEYLDEDSNEEQQEIDVLAKYRQNINNTKDLFSEEKAIDELIPENSKKINSNINVNNNFEMPNAFGVPKVGFKDIINKKK